MAAGFEVDPDQLDGQAARFKQVSQDLSDLGRLSSSAAAVDLNGTVAGPAFAQAWEQFASAYKGLANAAGAIGAKLNENARQYRETDNSTASKLDGARPQRRNPHLE